MRRCVIIAGADIKNYEVIRTYLRRDDFFIFCDSGLKHRGGLGVKPDLIIADFDSSENPELPVETIVLPHEKDDTDSMAAVKLAADRGFQDFLLIGVFGGRLDHALVNLYALLWLDNRGKKAMALDDRSEFEIVSRGPAYVKDCFPYFSLVSFAGKAEGITIKDALYTLEDAEITPEYQYAVSNEPLPGKTAEITVKKGSLLLIRDR